MTRRTFCVAVEFQHLVVPLSFCRDVEALSASTSSWARPSAARTDTIHHTSTCQRVHLILFLQAERGRSGASDLTFLFLLSQRQLNAAISLPSYTPVCSRPRQIWPFQNASIYWPKLSSSSSSSTPGGQRSETHSVYCIGPYPGYTGGDNFASKLKI